MAQGQNETTEQTAQARDTFLRFLRQRGDRVTRTRRVVLEHVMARHDHFRADELVATLNRGSGRVSRGTVYRTLALMEEAGLVRVLRDGDQHRHYEHTYGHGHHDHMICRACGRFVEFFDPSICDGIRAACQEHGFAEREHRLMIFGTCAACQKKRRTSDG